MTRPDALILAAFALYFCAQATLRIALGGALEVDEAEMLVLARGWQLGYGPQFPIYNWLQVALFQLIGEGTAALAILKNAVLWLATAGLYLGLRRVLDWPQALAGALSLALLPNVIWEFQRASTHSIALLAAISWTIWAVIGLLQNGKPRDYLLFGLIMGLGGLSKANYWVVPLVLLTCTHRLPGRPLPLSPRWLGLAAVLAVAIVALPYAWMLNHPELAFASTDKMFRATTTLPGPLEGLMEAAGGALAGLIVVVIATLLLWRFGRGRPATGPAWPGALLVRAGAITLGVSFLAILLVGMSQVQARWLVPAFVLLSSGLLTLAARRADPRALRLLSWAGAAFGLITLAGMAELRVNGPSTGGIDFSALAEQTDALKPDLVFADFHLGGNLRLLRPELNVIAPLPLPVPLGDHSVLLLTKGKEPPTALGAFAQRGLAAPPTTGTPLHVELPYRNDEKATFPVAGLFLPSAHLSPRSK